MLDYTVSIERLSRDRLCCLLKGYCVLDYTVFYRKVIACSIILCLSKGYCVPDVAVSIERLLRARLYCVY